MAGERQIRRFSIRPIKSINRRAALFVALARPAAVSRITEPAPAGSGTDIEHTEYLRQSYEINAPRPRH